jgi:predicted dinucleotide-binding enzyme
MKIAVVGVGNVGSIVGRRLAEAGHQVVFGVRDVKKADAIAGAKAASAGLDTVAGSVAGAEVVVLAVPWGAALQAVALAGDLTGKVLLDCTNPLTPDLSGLELGTTTSGGERIAQAAQGANVVKIFNTTGAGNMGNPRYGSRGMTMLYAGDDPEAKAIAARLAKELGFEPIDAGPLSASRLLEPFGLLWITLAIHQGMGTNFALNVVSRESP